MSCCWRTWANYLLVCLPSSTMKKSYPQHHWNLGLNTRMCLIHNSIDTSQSLCRRALCKWFNSPQAVNEPKNDLWQSTSSELWWNMEMASITNPKKNKTQEYATINRFIWIAEWLLDNYMTGSYGAQLTSCWSPSRFCCRKWRENTNKNIPRLKQKGNSTKISYFGQLNNDNNFYLCLCSKIMQDVIQTII